MTRKLFGRGVQGDLIGKIQVALNDQGHDTKGVDEIYGKDTAAAVASFQEAQGLPVTGKVDDDTWLALMQSPIPGIDERTLQLTAVFEGHGYSFALGNWDGAWITWGIIGFTLKHGEIQKILLNVHARAPQLMDYAFRDKAQEILRIVKASPAEQESWANSVSVQGRLAEPWRSGFERLGGTTEVREEQRNRVREDYFLPSVVNAKKMGLRSELGLALCFDIQVQNGGIGRKARAMIQESLERYPPAHELELRQVIAEAVAEASRQAYRHDVRQRKMTVATGRGSVHGHQFLLENWGLSEEPAAELA